MNKTTDSTEYHLLPNTWLGQGAPLFVDTYRKAFAQATELYVLTAFLTEWPKGMVLNPHCKKFRLIIGTDFGTTRRAAVAAALAWLPRSAKQGIRAFNERGVTFHPKIVLWRAHDGRRWMLVGSSNLTKAAFEKNVEANVTVQLSSAEWERATAWAEEIEKRSVEVNKRWLAKYEEAPPRGSAAARQGGAAGEDDGTLPVFDLSLGIEDAARQIKFREHLRYRRKQRTDFDKDSRRPLEQLFRREAATGGAWSKARKEGFYDELCRLWVDTSTRLGGRQWVIRGKDSNFGKLVASFVAIIDARGNRDDEVRRQLDHLAAEGVETRGAALTELLCHFYPEEYPILDGPVREWRRRVGFDKGIGGTEGERYLRLAFAMRAALRDEGPRSLGLKNLAELDTLIWFLQPPHSGGLVRGNRQ